MKNPKFDFIFNNEYMEQVKNEIKNRYKKEGKTYFKAKDLNLNISNRLIGRILKYIAGNDSEIILRLISPPNNNQSNRWFVENIKNEIKTEKTEGKNEE